MIWGEVETLRDLVRVVGDDPAIGHVLVFYDRPPGIAGAAAESWEAVEQGILAGAAVAAVPVMVAATLPELLDDDAAWRFISAGVAAVAGLRTGVRWPPRCGAGRRCGAAARDRRGVPERARGRRAGWRSTRRRRSLRARGVPVVVDGLH